MMMNREQTVQTFKRKLDEWNSDMDALEKKAETFEDEQRKAARQALDELHEQWDEAATDRARAHRSSAMDGGWGRHGTLSWRDVQK